MLVHFNPPPSNNRYRWLRALRVSIFYYLLLVCLLTQPYEFAFVGCVIVVVFHVFYKFHPQLYKQWTLGSIVGVGLFLLITPFVINQGFVLFLIAIMVISLCGYYIFFERYLFFFFALSLSTGIFYMTAISDPSHLLQVISLWLLGAIFAYVVICFDHYLILPNLARDHVNAEIMRYLFNGVQLLLDRFEYLISNDARYVQSQGSSPERYMNIGLLLNVCQLECPKLAKIQPAYQSLHQELKAFRYGLREIDRLSRRFGSPILSENVKWVTILHTESKAFYQTVSKALLDHEVSLFSLDKFRLALSELETNTVKQSTYHRAQPFSMERIHAWGNIMMACGAILEVMERILLLVNGIVSGKATASVQKQKAVVFSVPFQLDAIQFSLRYVIGLVVITVLNIGVGWLGGAATALQAVISFIVIMWRPHLGRSMRFAWYRLLGVAVGIVLGALILFVHVLVASELLFLALLFLAVLWSAYICLTEEKYGYMGLQIMIVLTIIVLTNYGSAPSFELAFLRVQGMLEGVFLAVIILLLFWQSNPIKQVCRIIRIISEIQHKWFVLLSQHAKGAASDQADQYLIEIETRYLVARDMINDMQYVHFAKKSDTESLRHKVERMHQLTSAVKTFERICFQINFQKWYKLSPSVLQAALNLLIDQWENADLVCIEQTLLTALERDENQFSEYLRMTIALLDIVRLLKKGDEYVG